MSIIDDALKQVEQPRQTGEQPLLTASRPKPRLRTLLPLVIIVVLAVGVGGWWLSAGSGGSDQTAGLARSVPLVSPVISVASPVDETFVAVESNSVAESGATDLTALTRVASQESVQPLSADQNVDELVGLTEINDQPGLQSSRDGQQVETLTLSSVDRQLSGEQLQLAGLTETGGQDNASPEVLLDTLDSGLVAQLTDGMQELPGEGASVDGGVAQLTGSVSTASGSGDSDDINQVSSLTDVEAEDDSRVSSAVSVLTEESAQKAPVDHDLVGLTQADSSSSVAMPDGQDVEPDIERLVVDGGQNQESVAGLTELARAPDTATVAGVSALTADEPVAEDSTGVDPADAEPIVAPIQGTTVSAPPVVDDMSALTSVISTNIAEQVPPAILLTRSEIDNRLRTARRDERAGKYQAALQRLVDIQATTPDILLLKARLLARNGEYERSGELLAGLGESELGAEASFWLGYGRFNLQQWQPAVIALQRAASLNSSDVVSSLYLGLALQQVGNYRSSIDAFHRVRSLQPDMPEVAFNTGISWWALGERERAMGAFRHFMRITDGQREAYASQRNRINQDFRTER